MHHRLSTVLAAGWVLALAGPAVAADNQSGSAAGGVLLSAPAQDALVTAEKKPPLHLTDQQRQAAIDAIVERKSHQATPKEFKPEVGASVPRQVDIHTMPPTLASALPTLQQYMYAHLDREIVILDALDNKIVALIPLPENLAQQSGAKPEGSAAAAADAKPAATTGQSVDKNIGSGQPTADPLRAGEETGKASAYTGPTTTGPNTDGK